MKTYILGFGLCTVLLMSLGCDDGSDGGDDLGDTGPGGERDTANDSESGGDENDTETEEETVIDTENLKRVDESENVTLAEMPDWEVTNDVCGFQDPVTLGAADEDGMVHVPANHPEIRYMGRVDCTDPEAPAFGFPGVTIRAGFEGTEIDMVLVDEGNSNEPNFYNIIIDDGEPMVLEAIPGENTYVLADALEDAEHTVEIYKRIESGGGRGRGEFLGFRIPEGTDLLPVDARPHRIEVIGDSISCGYGNELSTDDPDSYHYTTVNSNAYNAWVAIAARDLDAEYMAVAYSGRGIHRNYEDQAGDVLPEMYLNTIPDGESAPWETYRFTPEVLVINLGTNDFSPGIEDIDVAVTLYELTFLEFVEALRRFYPDTVIILAVGPMVTDAWPTGFRALSNITTSLENIIAAREADGDEDIHLLELPQQSSPYGEDWHPTVATHMEMAEILMTMIDDLDLM